MIPRASFAFLGAGIGSLELLVIAAAALVLFGPRELPKIMKTLGRIAAALRSASMDFQDQIARIADSDDKEDPQQAPPPGKPEPPPDATAEDKPAPKANDASATDRGENEHELAG